MFVKENVLRMHVRMYLKLSRYFLVISTIQSLGFEIRLENQDLVLVWCFYVMIFVL